MSPKKTILTAILITITMTSLSCSSLNLANSPKKDIVAKFDFESPQADLYNLDPNSASLTSDKNLVIAGQYSLKLDTTKGPNEPDPLFVTLPAGLSLQSGCRYKLEFNYSVKQRSPDASFYFTARSQTPNAPEQIYTLFREAPDNISYHYKNMIIPQGFDDYQIHFGIVGQAEIILDNIQISKLPTFDLDAEGTAVKSRNYEPYGMSTHLNWEVSQPVGDHPDWDSANRNGFTDSEVIKALDLLKQAGAQWIRIDASWADSEPEKGKYNSSRLNRLDLIVNQSEKVGVHTYILLFSTPKWASQKPDEKDFWAYAPADLNQWENYVRFIAERYKGRIQYWEIGNEIDWIFWRSSIPDYAQYLKIAYKTLKEVDPENQVIMSGLAFDGSYVWQFRGGAEENSLQKLYDAGVKNYFDIFAIHPYAHVWEDHTTKSIDSINHAYQIMRANGDDKPFWITELGTPSKLIGSEEKQAEYLRKVYTQIIKHPKVEKIFWYNFRNTAVGDEFEDAFGITNNDLTPKAAYQTFKNLSKPTTRKINNQLLSN